MLSMKNNSTKNGCEENAPSHLNDLQRRRWKTSYDLLRNRMNTPEAEAREFALKEVELLDEIDRELSLVEA